jgi:hypothetical protein
VDILLIELDIGFGRLDTAFVAVPALIKKPPLHLRSLIGDLSETGRVLFGLDLKPEQ